MACLPRVLVALPLFLVSDRALLEESASPGVQGVTLSRPFFNPTLGQKVRISFFLSDPGSLNLSILDREGFLVRRLASGRTVRKGSHSFDWDGRNDAGELAPDEAYSLKIDLKSAKGFVSYFPASQPLENIQVAGAGFDRQRGVITYRLPKPCRVQVKAASSPKTSPGRQLTRKTIAEWEPRTGGSIVEQWKGYDDSDTVNLLDLPDSSITIEARALPENSLITVGNRRTLFQDWVAKRSGASLFSLRRK